MPLPVVPPSNNITITYTPEAADRISGNLEGPLWDHKNLTYSFGSGGGFTGTPDAANQVVIEKAFAFWAQFDGLSFTQAAPGSKADIIVGWGDLASNQLGDTTYSAHSGPRPSFFSGTTIMLEDPALRAIDPNSGLYSGSTGSLFQAAAHEIGHALGLGNSSDRSAIMDPNFSDRNVPGFGLAQTPPTPPTSLTGIGTTSVSDLLPLGAMYGGNTIVINNDTTLPPVISFSGNETATYRFFDTTNGTQFLTTDVTERNNIIQSRPDLAYEGLGMGAIKDPTTDGNAAPVFRFFDNVHGTHFFTTSASEAATVAATRSDMTQEAPSVFEHMTKQTGDVAVYRFFNSNDGTHFYTNNATESASIIQTRPDMVSEGIAFYAPQT